jgi:hypothetical protein
MVINGKIFRGRLTPDNAFEDICTSFNDIPDACAAWYVEEDIPLLQKGVSTGVNRYFLLLVLIVLTGTTIVVIFVYRNWL